MYEAFAHYFDLFSGQAHDDLPVYVSLAQRTGGPVLELGCGSGRVLLALAQAGWAVTGIDNSPAMLALAQRKVEQAGLADSIQLIQSDMRTVALAPSFQLAICAQNTFCHMLTQADQLKLLRAARRCLQPGGYLALDVFNPDPAIIAAPDRRLVLLHTGTDPDTGYQVTQTLAREIDAGEQIEHVTTLIDEIHGGHNARHVFEFDLRYVFRFELELLLDKAGFTLEALYGSYELEPFDGDSERLLAVAQKTGV